MADTQAFVSTRQAAHEVLGVPTTTTTNNDSFTPRTSPPPPSRTSVPAINSNPSSRKPSRTSSPAVRGTTDAASTTINPSPLDSHDGSEEPTSAYGTRSRNRVGPRPNYSDDLDPKFDAGPQKVEVPKTKRPIVAESSSTPQPSTEMATAPVSAPRRSGFTAVNAPRPSASDAHPSSQVNGAKPTPTTEATEPRQKRKYQWKEGSRPSPSAKSSQKDASNGVVASDSRSHDMPDAPPAKKRKVGDVAMNGVSSSSSAASTSKKGSSNHAKAIGRGGCMVTFEKTRHKLKSGKLISDDSTVFSPGDYVYLICEPPGEPYYLARIMEFRHEIPNDSSSPVESILVNWFFRPKDIQRFSVDNRLLYASMQSDECALTTLRGKCTIKHRSEIGPSQTELDDYRRKDDTFWFQELYDRYIHRPYNLVPAKAVVNVPADVKKAIDERWKFLIVEQARMKELTSAVKTCKRCNGYCAPNDSVDCGVCRNTYHMACVNPPLAKKPSRGFAWSCGPCSRAQEKKLEARHTSLLTEGSTIDEEMHDDEDEPGKVLPAEKERTPQRAPTPPMSHNQAEVAKAQMWPWRYLGIHCNVEDVLQYDDRAIYPRASSRIGSRHQAVVGPHYKEPIQYVKPLEIKKKLANRGNNQKPVKLSKENIAALEREKAERAGKPWIQDAPPGYQERGGDETSTQLFVVPPDPSDKFEQASNEASYNEQICDAYLTKAKELARERGWARPLSLLKDGDKGQGSALGVPTNFLDRALTVLHKHKFQAGPALNELRTIKSTREFGDPILSQDELRKFEAGVAKYGSELRLVRRHVKSAAHRDVVRFYYIWKKTARGQEIWGRSEVRKGSKKRAEASWMDIADSDDDSAFDSAKSATRKRKFCCKHCGTRSSRLWRRAPAVAPGATVLADPKGSAKDRSNQHVVALCQRCAFVWRRYAVRWEDIDEVAKSFMQPGGRAWKRLQDELLLRDLIRANESAGVVTAGAAVTAASQLNITLEVEPPDPVTVKKLAKEKEKEAASTPAPLEPPKKKPPPPPPPVRPPTPPIVPAQPKFKSFACQVCRGDDGIAALVSCSSCRLTVHHRCYGIPMQVNAAKWACDTCANDRNNMFSLTYNCVLCPVFDRMPDMVEAPRVSHKKKDNREKERERLERQLADDLAVKYKREQMQKGRPSYPREALKHTSNNNWMHVTCAVWVPEIKLGKSTEFSDAEGVGVAIANPARADPLCKICRLPSTGAVVPCNADKCNASFHVGCAHEAGYRFGFDIKPVKGTRKDTLPTLSFGTETGSMTAVIYCINHEPASTSILHGLNEVNDKGETALEAFVRTYKQADTACTGTARKANMLIQAARTSVQSVQPSTAASAGRRTSLIKDSKARRNSRASPADDGTETANGDHPASDDFDSRECLTCGSTAPFRWWPASDDAVRNKVVDIHQANGDPPSASGGTQLQCHKCHVLEEHGAKPAAFKIEEDDNDDDSLGQLDLFKVTMPHTYDSYGQPAVPIPAQNATVLNADNAAQNERIIQGLWSSTILLNFPQRPKKPVAYLGQTFAPVHDKPDLLFDILMRRAIDEGGLDTRTQKIVSHQGKDVINPNTFMSALANIIANNAGERHWTVQPARDPPPPTPPALPMIHEYQGADPAPQYARAPSAAPMPLLRPPNYGLPSMPSMQQLVPSAPFTNGQPPQTVQSPPQTVRSPPQPGPVSRSESSSHPQPRLPSQPPPPVKREPPSQPPRPPPLTQPMQSQARVALPPSMQSNQSSPAHRLAQNVDNTLPELRANPLLPTGSNRAPSTGPPSAATNRDANNYFAQPAQIRSPPPRPLSQASTIASITQGSSTPNFAPDGIPIPSGHRRTTSNASQASNHWPGFSSTASGPGAGGAGVVRGHSVDGGSTNVRSPGASSSPKLHNLVH